MEPTPIITSPLNAEDFAALTRAKEELESPLLTMKLASVVGAPIEKLMGRLPSSAQDKVDEATQLALKECLQVALRTIGKSAPSDSLLAPPPNKPSEQSDAQTRGRGGRRVRHVFAARRIAGDHHVDVSLDLRYSAQRGEDVHRVETQLQCMMVLGMGGTNKSDDNADLGYFIVRSALAQSVSRTTSEIATKGLSSHGSTALLKFVQTIASRFSVQVSEQVAAKSIPAIGAMVNTVFMDHFQQMAHGHFTVRRLERRYGTAVVERAYQTIEVIGGR